MLQSVLARLPARRWWYLAVAVAAFAVIGDALYLQYYKYWDPCWLCYLQRAFLILVGSIALLAAIINPARLGARITAGLLTLTAMGGGAVSIRHLYIQSLPPDQVPSCGKTVEALIETMPYFQALLKMWHGSAECAEKFGFFGITLPGWGLMFFTAVIVVAWLAVAKQPPTAIKA